MPGNDLNQQKFYVMQLVKELITSGSILSPETNEPLTTAEQGTYISGFMFYVQKEETKWNQHSWNISRLAPVYDNILQLQRLIEDTELFRETLKSHVVSMCQIPVRDQSKFEEYMEEFRRLHMPHGTEAQPAGAHSEDQSQRSLLVKFVNYCKDTGVALFTGGGAVATFGKSVLSSAMDEVALTFSGTVQTYSLASATRASAGASGLYLAGVLGYNVYQVARGRRTWRRAGKNLTEETAATFAGAGVGLAVAGLFAPFTAGLSLFFGAVAGIAASLFTRSQVKKYTGRWFNIPEDEVLEKAYNVHNSEEIEVNQRVSDNTLAKAYRLQSRKYHPDKFLQNRPNATEAEKSRNLRSFLKVQAAYAMIKAARAKNDEEYDDARRAFEEIEEQEELERKSVPAYLRMWGFQLMNKIRAKLGMESRRRDLPAITNGILPIEFYEEVGEEAAEEGNKRQRETVHGA